MIYRALLAAYKHSPTFIRNAALWALTPKYTVGVALVAFDDASRVLLFEHSYDAEGSWRLPGGLLRRGEPPCEALLRELREEGGSRIEQGRVVHVGVNRHWPASMTIYYAARLLAPPQEATAEVSRWRLYAPEDLPETVPSGIRLVIERAYSRDEEWTDSP